MNTLRGAILPGRKTVPKLKPYSKQLRLIASPRQSIKRRRKLMIHQLGAGVWSELRRCYHYAKTHYRHWDETSLVPTTAVCAWRVDDVGNPLEKPSPTNERKISQEVCVQKSISIPSLWIRHSLLTMDGISGTPVENSVQFLRLRDKYKSDLRW